MDRRVGHVLVGIGFWLVFGWLWADLVRDGSLAARAPRTLLIVAAVAVVVVAVTAGWVRHNIGIYRRLGPRSGMSLLPPPADADRLGCPVRWDLPGGHLAALEARHLVVELGDGAKRYRAAGEEA